MNIHHLSILNELLNETCATQRELAEKSGYSLGLVNSGTQSLIQEAYLTPDYRPTEAAYVLAEATSPRRAIILAAGAGMRAEGVGAKTKWYFWPNAQMREFIGLLASEWKVNLLFIVAIVAVSLFFSNISTFVQWAIG